MGSRLLAGHGNYSCAKPWDYLRHSAGSYALGYLLAAIVYGLFLSLIGWRGMFVVGVLPALLVLYIRVKVKESPVWSRRNRRVEPSTFKGLGPYRPALETFSLRDPAHDGL